MNSIFEELQPNDLDAVENYLYFDNNEDSFIEHNTNAFRIEQFIKNEDFIQSMSNQDFCKFIQSYDLPSTTRHAYETEFQKTKRIYKRDKAKNRRNSSLKLLEPLLKIETQENIKTTFLNQSPNIKQDKQEEQKKRKRISAQVSRDRKKLYVQQIEKENEELKQKYQQLEEQNKKLKMSSKQRTIQSKKSLKGWFIMSLILLSLQQENQMTGVQSTPNLNPLDQFNSLSKFEYLLNEYEKVPINRRFLNLQHYKHFIEINEQEYVLPSKSQILSMTVQDIKSVSETEQDSNKYPLSYQKKRTKHIGQKY